MAIRGNPWQSVENDGQGDGGGTPEGLQEMTATSVAEAVKQSLARRELAPVDPHTSAGTSSSGKSKAIKEVTTRKSSVWLLRHIKAWLNNFA